MKKLLLILLIFCPVLLSADESDVILKDTGDAPVLIKVDDEPREKLSFDHVGGVDNPAQDGEAKSDWVKYINLLIGAVLIISALGMILRDGKKGNKKLGIFLLVLGVFIIAQSYVDFW